MSAQNFLDLDFRMPYNFFHSGGMLVDSLENIESSCNGGIEKILPQEVIDRSGNLALLAGPFWCPQNQICTVNQCE